MIVYLFDNGKHIRLKFIGSKGTYTNIDLLRMSVSFVASSKTEDNIGWSLRDILEDRDYIAYKTG
jgi:hypothetical protein